MAFKNSFEILQFALLTLLPFHQKPTAVPEICSITTEDENQLTVKKMLKIFLENDILSMNYVQPPLKL